MLWSFLGAIAFLVWLSTIATLIVLFLAVAYLVDLLVWSPPSSPEARVANGHLTEAHLTDEKESYY